MAEYITMEKLAEYVVAWQNSTGKERDCIFNKVLKSVERYIYKDVRKKLKNFSDYELENGMQAGRIALFKAMTKWDNTKAAEHGASFLSYLSFWVKPEVYRLINKELLGPVHVPLEKRFAAWKQQRAIEEGTGGSSNLNYDHFPKFVSPEYAEWLDDEENADEFMLTNRMSVNPETGDNIEKNQRKEILNLSVALLSEKQRYTLRGHLRGESFTSIGKEIGVSKQAVAFNIHAAKKNVKRIYKELYKNPAALNDAKKQFQTHN